MQEDMADPLPKALLRRYEISGFLGGLFVGLMAATIFAGPHLQTWATGKSLLMIAGGGAIGGLVGYLAITLAAATLVSGFSEADRTSGSGSGADGRLPGDGSGDDGDGAGDGGD